MRKILLAASLALACLPAWADGLVARGFKALPNDPTATLHGTEVKDRNGRTTALLKIYTPFPASELGFNGGLLAVEKVEQRGPGEVWVYLPEKSQKLTVNHPTYGVVAITYPGIGALKGGSTYSVEMTAEGTDVSLIGSATGAEITVDGRAMGQTPVNTYLPYGAHQVSARQGNLVYEGIVQVSRNGKTEFYLPMEDENLQFGDVTFKVPEGVEIWFLNRREGVGEYTTRLRGGQYSVETRKKDHDPVMTAFTVEPGKAQTFYPDAPIPHRGYLELALVPPTGVTVQSADTIVDLQPSMQLPTGPYEFTFSRRGYVPQTRLFEVGWNTTTADTVVLRKKQYVAASGLYASAGFVAMPETGVGFSIGGLVKSVELNASYIMGLGRSKTVNWYDEADNLLSYQSDYRTDRLSFSAGYRLRFAERFGLTPNLGAQWQFLTAPKGNPGRDFSLWSLNIGLRLLYNPWEYLGFYLSPSYALPLSEKGQMKEVCRLAGITRGGFGLQVGIQASLPL